MNAQDATCVLETEIVSAWGDALTPAEVDALGAIEWRFAPTPEYMRTLGAWRRTFCDLVRALDPDLDSVLHVSKGTA